MDQSLAMPNGSCNGAQMRAILKSRLPAWMFPLPLVWPPINEFRQPALEKTMEQVSRVSGLRSLVPSLSHVSVFVFDNVTTLAMPKGSRIDAQSNEKPQSSCLLAGRRH